MTPREFCKRVCSAGAGDLILYHRGFLAVDRAESRILNKTADLALRVGGIKGYPPHGSNVMGAGDLFQLRRDDGRYDYTLTMQRSLTVHEREALATC